MDDLYTTYDAFQIYWKPATRIEQVGRTEFEPISLR